MSKTVLGSTNFGPSFVYHPRSLHTHTFIILHGAGGDSTFGASFMTASHSSGKPLQDVLPNVKFIFPCAKRLKQIMTVWFDFAGRQDLEWVTDGQSLEDSLKHIERIIFEEVRHVPLRNILLAGLSQGCAMALSVLLLWNLPEPLRGQRLGGVVGLSGWLPQRRAIESAMREHGLVRDELEPSRPETGSQRLKPYEQEYKVLSAIRRSRGVVEPDDQSPSTTAIISTPIFLGHGTYDATVPITHGEGPRETLMRLGIDVDWKTYEHGHWYKEPEEIDHIVAFAKRVMSATVDES